MGNIYVDGNAVATPIGSSGTWVKVAVFASSDVGLDVVPTVGSHQISITTTGYYLVGFNVSFTGTVDDVIELEVQTTTGTRFRAVHSEVKVVATGKIMTASATSALSLTAGQILALYVNNNTAANNITAKDVSLFVVRLA